MKITIFSEQISKLVEQLCTRREEIKEEFTKAYLASIMPDGADVDWIIQNVELVEQWHDSDRSGVSWSFRMKGG